VFKDKALCVFFGRELWSETFSPETLLFAGGPALGISSGDPMKEIVIVFQKGINTLSNLLVFMKSSIFRWSREKIRFLQSGKNKSRWGVMNHS